MDNLTPRELSAKAIQGCTVDDLKQMVLDKIMSIEPSKTSKTKLGF